MKTKKTTAKGSHLWTAVFSSPLWHTNIRVLTKRRNPEDAINLAVKAAHEQGLVDQVLKSLEYVGEIDNA